MIVSIAQRLVRKICAHCAETDTPSQEMLTELRVTAEELDGANFRRGRGCDKCRHTGYSGRVAIYEMLPFTSDIKEMTVRRETSPAIKQRGRQSGMRTLRDSGWTRVRNGITTVEEVLRVTVDSDVLA